MNALMSLKLTVGKALPLHGEGIAKYVVLMGNLMSMTGTREEIESFAHQLLASLPEQEPEVKNKVRGEAA